MLRSARLLLLQIHKSHLKQIVKWVGHLKAIIQGLPLVVSHQLVAVVSLLLVVQAILPLVAVVSLLMGVQPVLPSVCYKQTSGLMLTIP